MKNNYMAWLAAGTILLSTSCINDLDTLPLNPSDSTVETVYGADEASYIAGLAQIYFTFISNDLTDLRLSDGGASELNRAFWSVQEITSDGAKCAWENDAWVRAMNTNTWSDADNDATYAVYVRSLQGVSFVNEFLRQTTDDKLSKRGVSDTVHAKIQSLRAEARYLRAYFYWMSMDTFGNIPFTTEDSPFGTELAPQKSRAEVFAYISSELESLVAPGSPMPAARSNYPRADQGAVYGLLSRLYLNAEVYTGTPMWDEAAKACEAVFTLGYDLCGDYASLFRGDNGENPDALKEFIFAVPYDAESTQSYGGTSYLTLAAIAADEKINNDETSAVDINGVNNGWGGIRIPYNYVEKFFAPTDKDYSGKGSYTIKDKRGATAFYIGGRVETMDNALYVFKNGWSCIKFNNIPHDMTAEQFKQTALSKGYSDIDMPLIRLGEICLTYAEACMNGSYGKAKALPKLQDLATRAGVTPPTDYDQDFLVSERARELMWESLRRTDLIRFGLFTGSKYMWAWKGGIFTGQEFPSYKVCFAIPIPELNSNPNLQQTEGYAKPNS